MVFFLLSFISNFLSCCSFVILIDFLQLFEFSTTTFRLLFPFFLFELDLSLEIFLVCFFNLLSLYLPFFLFLELGFDFFLTNLWLLSLRVSSLCLFLAICSRPFPSFLLLLHSLCLMKKTVSRNAILILNTKHTDIIKISKYPKNL